MEIVKAKIVMLPRSKGQNKSSIKLYQGELFYDFEHFMSGDAAHQHLYVITDEITKGGDWFYNKYDHKIGQYGIRQKPEQSPYVSKIIATTDVSLKIPSGEPYESQDLMKSVIYPTKEMPQIPNSFIKNYCKAGGIKKVLVELEEYGEELGSDPAYYGLPSHRIKVNSSNEIVVRPIKDSWTIEEILELTNSAWYDGFGEGQSTCMGPLGCSSEVDSYKDWEKKNL